MEFFLKLLKFNKNIINTGIREPRKSNWIPVPKADKIEFLIRLKFF